MMNKETMMFVVSTPDADGDQIAIETFTSLGEALDFAVTVADSIVTECKLVVGQFGMKLIPV